METCRWCGYNIEKARFNTWQHTTTGKAECEHAAAGIFRSKAEPGKLRDRTNVGKNMDQKT